MIVEGVVVVENKATQALVQADRNQILNYLRSTELEVGLLLHFGPKARFERFILTNDRMALAVLAFVRAVSVLVRGCAQGRLQAESSP